ncbi:hypothetical protein GGR56DRAFT_624220 [Xylariaceae sp. FL0804]|nr:hypothetical protein GGR56DRAFT_624220 [Xylariaceae sp. FL0804]
MRPNESSRPHISTKPISSISPNPSAIPNPFTKSTPSTKPTQASSFPLSSEPTSSLLSPTSSKPTAISPFTTTWKTTTTLKSTTTSKSNFPPSTTPIPTSSETSGPSSGPTSGTTTLKPITITSTLTMIPPGFSTETFPTLGLTSNTWIATESDGQKTVVPVLFGCLGCGGDTSAIIIWDVQSVPNVLFSLPRNPSLPSFSLPCIPILGRTCKQGPVDEPGDVEPSFIINKVILVEL